MWPWDLFKLKHSTLSYFGLSIFWLLQVNPLTIWVMSESSGLGYGSVRSSFFILGVSILFSILVFKHLVGASQGFFVTKAIVRFLSILFILVLVRINIDLLAYGSLDFVGVFPFIEFIVSAFLFSRFNVYKYVNENIDQIRYFAVLIMLADIIAWAYSILAGVSFGVFRANISGLELNRMADLFYTGVASFVLIDKKSKLTYRSIALLTILVTLYRSAYLASIGVFIYYYYQNRKTLNISKMISRFLGTIMGSFLVIAIIGGWVFNDFSLIDVLLERFLSTFLSEGEVYGEVSKSERFDQIEPLLYAFLENVFVGAGFGFYLLEQPIYNYFNYIAVSLVIMGLPLVVGLIVPVTYLMRKLFVVAEMESDSPNLLVNSMVVYFFVLINVFPYMTYFPISSVFAFAICYHLWAGSHGGIAKKTAKMNALAPQVGQRASSH